MDYNFSDKTKQAIGISQSIAREFLNAEFSPAHLLKALLHKEIGLRTLLEEMGKDFWYMEEWADVRIESYPKAGKAIEQPPADKDVKAVLREADTIRLKLSEEAITPVSVLTALTIPGVGFSYEQLKTFNLTQNEILDRLVEKSDLQNVIGTSTETGAISSADKKQNALLKYCTELTGQAREGKLDPVVGRDREIRMIVEILGRRSKPNVIVKGEPGVGKTALINGFAQNIAAEKIPGNLSGTKIFELDFGSLVAGASYKGEVEDRLKNIIKEIQQFEKAILYIDNIHMLLDNQSGASGAANLLKPELDKGMLTIIANSLPISLQKKFNEVKLGTLYLLGEIPLSEMHARWTNVAEYFFVKAAEKTFPKNCPIIIAGGKFGSGEMYFASDLDVVFILQDKLKLTHPAVEKKIPEIQKKLLDENGNQILAMDMKLRPEGKSAPLLMTESEYETYIKKRLSIWEAMAMTRFRNVVPSSSEHVFSERVETLIASTLKNFKLNRASVEEIATIYNKVIQSKKYFDEIDVKSGDGGMFAIELLVQTLALSNSQKMADAFPGKMVDLIEKLKNISALPDETAIEMRDTYEFYRGIELANYVSLSKTNHKIPHTEHELSSLALHLDFKNPAEFLASLKSRMRRISSLFRKMTADLAAQAD